MKTLEHLKKFESKKFIRSLKRKKFCRYTKGEHEFEKVIPRYLIGFNKFKDITDVEEFYEIFNNRDSKHCFGAKDLFYYKCKLCGKEKMEMVPKDICPTKLFH